MELNTRWIKIFKDIWDHKTRSLLVILSIAVGVAAVGMINNAKSMIERDLFGPYLAGNPTLVQIYVSRFDDSLTNAVAGMREVEIVQPRRTTGATIFQPNGISRDISLMTVPDFNDIQVNRLPVEQGTGMPGVREILLERESAAGMGVKLGDKVTVDRRRHLARHLHSTVYAGQASRRLRVDVHVGMDGPEGLLQPLGHRDDREQIQSRARA